MAQATQQVIDRLHAAGDEEAAGRLAALHRGYKRYKARPMKLEAEPLRYAWAPFVASDEDGRGC